MPKLSETLTNTLCARQTCRTAAGSQGEPTVVTTAGWEQVMSLLSLQEELWRTATKCTRLCSGAARTAAEMAELAECTAGEASSCGRATCQKLGACCHPLRVSTLSC